MSRSIAIFDFDNTLVTKDTLFDFLLYSYGTKTFISNMIRELPFLAGNRMGLIPSDKAKSKLLKAFFKEESRESLSRRMERYSLDRIPRILNRKMYERVLWHKRRKHLLVIATASIYQWISPWAKKQGFRYVISTKLQFSDTIFSGNFVGKNCSGEVKYKRILSTIPDLHSYEIYAYSDNKSDRKLLELADHSFTPEKQS